MTFAAGVAEWVLAGEISDTVDDESDRLRSPDTADAPLSCRIQLTVYNPK